MIDLDNDVIRQAVRESLYDREVTYGHASLNTDELVALVRACGMSNTNGDAYDLIDAQGNLIDALLVELYRRIFGEDE